MQLRKPANPVAASFLTAGLQSTPLMHPCCHLTVAHSKEAEVDHVRFNASYKAMQFDPELLNDQRRRGWGDRQLSNLGIEQRPDGGILVVVVVERIDGKLLRWAEHCLSCWSKDAGVVEQGSSSCTHAATGLTVHTAASTAGRQKL